MVTPISVILTLFLFFTEITPCRVQSAPMVYQRENNGSWTAYNIGRDYLGSITHVAKADGTPIEENSYDPWGRLRNPESLTVYQSGSEPELFLGRGFTGHEHLGWFGLVNMNARLYDPLLGRFLSPDPYVQAPDFTQNYNRYSYCLNNPLKYTDESGEFIISGTVAVICTIVAVSAGAGLGVYEGYRIAERNNWEGRDKTWAMVGGGLIGGVAGFASSIVGAAVGIEAAAAGVGGFYVGAASGAAAGFAGGFVHGFGMTTLETGDPLFGLKQGIYQGCVAGLSGALLGGLVQGTVSSIKGNSFWDGSSGVAKISPFEKGQEGVNMAKDQAIREGGTIQGSEVTIEVDGTRVKIDLVAEMDGKMTLIEVKNGLMLDLLQTQKSYIPIFC